MLTGELVTLRSYERTDIPAMWAMWNDIEVETRGSSGKVWPMTMARLEHAHEDEAKQEAGKSGQVTWVMDVGGEVVGWIQLWGTDEHNGRSNIGITVRRESWSQGYGQDALRTLVRYAFQHLNLRKLSLQVIADDERAVACYRKAGFVEEGRLRMHSWYDGAFRDELWMAVLREG